MRRNSFNESYCHNLTEVQQVLDDKGLTLDDVHAAAPIEFEVDKACIEVLENESGETALYIEAPTIVGVRDILKELRIEVIE